MRVFDTAWVKDIEQRYERFPPNQRPIIYAIAVHENRQPLRAEIEAWVGTLSSTAKAKIIPRLRSPENIQQSYNELAVGHALRKLGYDLEYEKPFDDMTPDWLVSPRGAEPAFVVETFTANPPKSRTDDLKRLDHLLGRIHEILVGVVLNIHTNLPKTPKERESKKIKNEVEWWLISGSPAVGEQLRLEGFTFEIVAEGASYDHVLTIGPSSPPGTFWVDANPLRKGVKEKVRKYDAKGSTRIPLVVSVIADFYTGLTYEDFESAVLGSETGQSYRRHNDGLLTQVDSALSAVLWVSKEAGVWRATAIHNPGATNPLSSSTFKQPAR